MSTSITPSRQTSRILIVGRSPAALLDTVKALRAKGYAADATNRFGEVLVDYDVGELELLVFGGMIPLDQKQYLLQEIRRRNPGVRIVQGLTGIAEVLVAQVQAELSSEPPTAAVAYVRERDVITIELAEPAHVAAQALFGTFVPPVPTSSALDLVDADLPAGSHTIGVSPQASFAVVSVGSQVDVLTIAGVPEAATRLAPITASDHRLPEVAAVTTHNGELSNSAADV